MPAYRGPRFFGMRPWPAPVWGPLKPFFFAACITTYGIYKLEDAMVESPEWRNDPRNPKVISGERKPVAENPDNSEARGH